MHDCRQKTLHSPLHLTFEGHRERLKQLVLLHEARGNTPFAAFLLPCDQAPAIYSYLAPGVIDVWIRPITTTFEGTAANIPADKQLWILVTVEGVTGYFPQPGPVSVSPGGKWSAQITVGIQTDKGKKFTLYAVLADKDGQATINQFFMQKPSPNYVGITNLQGITIMNTVNVIRD